MENKLAIEEMTTEEKLTVLISMKLSKKHAVARAKTEAERIDAQAEFVALQWAIRTLSEQFPTEANS